MSSIPNEAITLTRDVDAYLVPSGDKITLLSGNVVRITQLQFPGKKPIDIRNIQTTKSSLFKVGQQCQKN